jgi:hypothetical protein
MNKTYKFAIILLVLAAVVILSGCTNKSGNGNGNNASTTPTPSELTPAQKSAEVATLHGNNTSSASNIINASHGRRLYNIAMNHTISNNTTNVSA